MIIDEILSRKNGWGYDAKEFYNYCNWSGGDDGKRGWPIARAMDEGTNKQVAQNILKYIFEIKYITTMDEKAWELIRFIFSANWLEDEPMSEKLEAYLQGMAQEV